MNQHGTVEFDSYAANVSYADDTSRNRATIALQCSLRKIQSGARMYRFRSNCEHKRYLAYWAAMTNGQPVHVKHVAHDALRGYESCLKVDYRVLSDVDFDGLAYANITKRGYNLKQCCGD